MGTVTLTEDKDFDDLTLAAGDTIALGGYTLTSKRDASQLSFRLNGPGKIILLDGCYLRIGWNAIPSTVIIQGGTSESPLPPFGNHGFPLNASAVIDAGFKSFSKIISICSEIGANWKRKQFAKVLSAYGTTVVLDRDMELEVGDVVGFNVPTSQTKDPNQLPSTVTSYDPLTHTVTLSPLTLVPNTGSQCVLLTSAFVLTCSTETRFSGTITGDELGIYTGTTQKNSACLDGKCFLRRFVSAGKSWQYEHDVFGYNTFARLGIYVSTGGTGGNYAEMVGYSADIGVAYCASLTNGYYNQTAAKCGAGVVVHGGDVSIWPSAPCGYMEFVDTDLPSSLYASLSSTSELVVRTTNPPTCVIHRNSGIATLVKKSGGDTVMEASPVAEAFQLVPSGTEAVWHDQPATVEPGKKLIVSWLAYFGTGATGGGVQILVDSPLFGQVAVPMGTADVLAEYTESSPPLDVWGPSRLLSWRNTSGQPVRVWVRGWGKGGTVYSSVQVVKGGEL